MSAHLSSRQATGLLLRALVAAVLAVFIGSAAAAAVPDPAARYESRAVLLIDQPTRIAQSGDEGVIVKLIRLRVKYADLLRTDPLAAPVAEEVGVDLATAKSGLRAEIPVQSLLLRVVGSADDPETAQALAVAGAEVVQQYAAEEQAADDVAPADRIEFTLVDGADPGRAVDQPRARRLTVAAVSGALAIVLVLALFEAAGRWRRGTPTSHP